MLLLYVSYILTHSFQYFFVLIFITIFYLQVSDFPFPLASIAHEGAVDNKSLHLTTHEIIWKNLKTKKTKFLKMSRLICVVQGK